AGGFENVLTSRSITLQGGREDGSSIWIDGVERVAIGSGTWTVNLSLPGGSSTLTLFAKDEAGNPSLSDTVIFLIDSNAPWANGVMSPSHGSYINIIPQNIQFGFNETGSGLNESATAFTVSRDGFSVAGAWSATTNTLTFVPSLSLVDGAYQISVQLGDFAGNISPTFQRVFTLDQIPPESPTVDALPATTNILTAQLSGTKQAGTGIVIDGILVVGVNNNLTWSHTVSLVGGSNSFSITARDSAGNESPAVGVSIEYDDTPPGLVNL
ncbi:MAG: hypothetical protein GY934_01805, partial [Gammaproteobacteria bacterium]|nr:hypothetical protein [Gammaproteobacteria bacterium]